MSHTKNKNQTLSITETQQNEVAQQAIHSNTVEHSEAQTQLLLTVQRVHHMYQQQHYKEALLEIIGLQQQYPEHPAIMSLTAMVYKRVAPDKALYWAAEALKRNMFQPDAWRVRMSIYYDREEWIAFETAAQQLTIIASDDPTPHLLLAQYHIRKGALEKALLLLERCISIAPLAAAYATYSYVLALLKRIPESKEAECKALAKQQNHAYTWMQLAWAAEQRGEHKHAFTLIEKAIRLNPNDPQIRREYIDALQKIHLWFRLCWWLPKQFSRLPPFVWFILSIITAVIQPLLFISFIMLHVTTYWLSHLFVNWRIYGKPWVG